MPRVYIEGILYYITSGADFNEKLFKDDEDYQTYLAFLKEYKRQYHFKLYGFCLLPQHIHLLIEVEEGSHLSDIMHNITSRYTKYFNGKYERKGHLFQGRFKAAIIEKEPYLPTIVNYLHFAPKRINLTESVHEYPYSSCKVHLRLGLEDFAPYMEEEVKELVGYPPYTMDEKEATALYKGIFKKKIMGSKAFIDEVQAKIKEKKEAPPSVSPPRKRQVVAVAASFALAVIIGSITYYLYSTKKLLATPQLVIVEKEVSSEGSAQEDGDIKSDFNGVEFEIELTRLSSGGTKEILLRDRLRFKNGKVYSKNLSERGFRASNYTLTYRDDGTIVWETMQSKDTGEVASWYGEWDGKVMKGILSQRPTPQGKSRDFSFLSKWYRKYQGNG